jgi:PTS system nitrogen regulatory IIA component
MTDTKPLYQYLNVCTISVQSSLTSRKKLLQEMARLLSFSLLDEAIEEQEEIVEKDVYHALLEREKLGNTGIGDGIAIPHSRFENAHEAIVAIIVLDEPVDYESSDRQPVKIAFGLLVPQNATHEHLTILSSIARMMSEQSKRDDLGAATSAQHAIEIIQAWES